MIESEKAASQVDPMSAIPKLEADGISPMASGLSPNTAQPQKIAQSKDMNA